MKYHIILPLAATVFALPLLPLRAAPVPKQGAVAFRFDDNKTVDVLQQLNAVFQKHNAPISYAVNITRPVPAAVNDQEHIAVLKEIVRNGGEIMDHSPTHSCMQIIFPTPSDAEAVKNDPGVDHVEGNTAFLKYHFNEKYSRNKPMTVAIKGNQLLIPSDAVKMALRNEDFLVFPNGTVYGVHCTNGVYTLCSSYGRQIIVPDGENINVIRTDRWGLQVTDDALRLLARTSRVYFQKAGLPTPKVFIEPGGWGIFPSGAQLARIYGKEFGYIAGDAYNRWYGVYSRPDLASARFSLSPDWDSLERLDVSAAKKHIADLIAKHRVNIFISHLWFHNVPGGRDEFFRRHDELLAWLRAKNIPILTVSQCAERLFDQPADPEFNLMPPLTNDLDEDGVPDGYELSQDTELKNNALHREQTGEVFTIRRLSGIEPGINSFSCKITAPAGTLVTVRIGIYRENNSDKVDQWLPDLQFTPKETTELLTQTFSVPEWCPAIDVICTVKGQGHVELSKFSVCK